MTKELQSLPERSEDPNDAELREMIQAAALYLCEKGHKDSAVIGSVEVVDLLVGFALRRIATVAKCNEVPSAQPGVDSIVSEDELLARLKASEAPPAPVSDAVVEAHIAALKGYTKLHMTSCQGSSDTKCTCWADRFKVIHARLLALQAAMSGKPLGLNHFGDVVCEHRLPMQDGCNPCQRKIDQYDKTGKRIPPSPSGGEGRS